VSKFQQHTLARCWENNTTARFLY